MSVASDVLTALNALFRPGDVIELRILGSINDRQTTISGYFDDFQKFAQVVQQWSGRPRIEGVYWTLNPCNPALLARCANAVKQGAKVTTGDKDIHQRVHLLIDFDPTRPNGISSTNDEKACAHVLAKKVKDHLADQGWPEPFFADSGNGYHLIYAIDLPNDDESRDLIQSCLEALAKRFDVEGKVKIDRTVYNAGRISKVYGSLAAKGDSTVDRPHRTAHLHPSDQPPMAVSRARLTALAAEAPKKSASFTGNSVGQIAPEKIEEFLAEAKITHRERISNDRDFRHKWLLDNCWFDASHTATSVFVAINNEGKLAYHCSHDSCLDKEWKTFRASVEDRLGRAFRFTSPEPRTTSTELTYSLETRCFADIETRPVEWLWRDRIPKNKLTCLFGDPDKGKSLISLDTTARCTTGARWPDGSPNDEQGEAFILSAEDNPEDTIKPRLLAAGADVKRIHLIEKVNVKQGAKQTERDFALSTDLDLLEQKLSENPRVHLIVVDPITSYLTGANMNKEQELRRVLTPIKSLCEKFNVTVLCLGHHNKRSDVGALHKVAGAVAMTGVARMVWGCIDNPDKPGEYLMLLVKGNIARKRSGLRYRISDRPIGNLTEPVPYIDWQPGEVTESADSILNATREKREKRHSRAERFLSEYLADCEKRSDDIMAAAGKQDPPIARNALFEAKRLLNIKAIRKGGVWWWMSPGMEEEKPKTEVQESSLPF